MKSKKAIALIELLVVVALIGIVSAVGVVTYNGYISTAKDNASLSNFNRIVKTMDNELANCRINPWHKRLQITVAAQILSQV